MHWWLASFLEHTCNSLYGFSKVHVKHDAEMQVPGKIQKVIPTSREVTSLVQNLNLRAGCYFV